MGTKDAHVDRLKMIEHLRSVAILACNAAATLDIQSNGEYPVVQCDKAMDLIEDMQRDLSIVENIAQDYTSDCIEPDPGRHAPDGA